MGHRAGLDYAAIAPTARLAGLALTPDIFRDLRTMEATALAVLAKATAK